jgi:hypothetical protein
MALNPIDRCHDESDTIAAALAWHEQLNGEEIAALPGWRGFSWDI